MKAWSWLKTHAAATLIVISISASFITHVSFRNSHFQEVDSAGTYDIIYGFPASTLRFTALMYKPGSFLSEEKAREILANPAVSKIRHTHLSSFSDDFLVEQLTKTSPLAALRYATTQLIANINLPFPMQSFFATGLGSTYSSGTGFVYGLLSSADTGYEDFMSRSMVVSILVFHLATLSLFLILRRLGVHDLVSVPITLILLFSISLYSAGIHVGSTVWNFSTEFFWILLFLLRSGKRNEATIISVASGILVFFNYLIVLFWLAYVFRAVSLSSLRQKISLARLFTFARTSLQEQWPAVVLIGICGGLFYHPGQGFRGEASLAELPATFYYITLNFVSWFSGTGLINVLQFAIGTLLVGFACMFLFKKADNTGSEPVRNIMRFVFCTYVILVIMKILSFAPTRHVLFLTPILFISAALGLHARMSKSTRRLPKPLLAGAALALTALGFYGLRVRHMQAADLTGLIAVDQDVTSVGIYDASFNIYYMLQDKGHTVDFINPGHFEEGRTYLYVSQVEPFSFALDQWRQTFELDIEVLRESERVTNTYFIANNPDFEKYRYSRPNNLYQTKFKVIRTEMK